MNKEKQGYADWRSDNEEHIALIEEVLTKKERGLLDGLLMNAWAAGELSGVQEAVGSFEQIMGGAK